MHGVSLPHVTIDYLSEIIFLPLNRENLSLQDGFFGFFFD
jgi:hypothetical protein